jgi:hypothetical protein
LGRLLPPACATVCRRFTIARGACPGPFDQLHQGHQEALNRLEAAKVSALDPAVMLPAQTDSDHLQKVFDDPGQSGRRWLLGTGYLDAWRRLHAVEEALLSVDPVELVIKSALLDENRIGSNIPQGAALLKRVRFAIVDLSPAAGRYLAEAPPALTAAATAGRTVDAGPSANEDSAMRDARAALASVRAAVNDFRDGRRDALVRARNRLVATVLFAGITGCTLLYVAILSGAPQSSIVAVSAFYLVGAMVGLVTQLQTASTAAGATQDDYGARRRAPDPDATLLGAGGRRRRGPCEADAATDRVEFLTARDVQPREEPVWAGRCGLLRACAGAAAG